MLHGDIRLLRFLGLPTSPQVGTRFACSRRAKAEARYSYEKRLAPISSRRTSSSIGF